MLKTTSQIYKALKDLGFSKTQVKVLLPTWWSADIEGTPDGASQLAVIISRRFNLDLPDLLAGKATHKQEDFGIAYKHAASTHYPTLNPATQIAKALTLAVLDGMTLPFLGVPSTAAEIENAIRRASPSGLLDLDAIAAYCWTRGIPVIPLAQLPTGLRKMDGAAMNIKGRPAIILSRNTTSKSWLSFILAHELGHIALGHIAEGTAIVDVKLTHEATQLADTDTDSQEEEANQFALTLLGGTLVPQEIDQWSPHLTSTEIALKSLEFQAAHHFPAGHIALRYGFKYKRWIDAQNALRFMPEDKDPEGALASLMKTQIDFDKLAEDSVDLISRLTESVG
jgi:hypothetical protein